MTKTLVIVPTFNERENLAVLVEAIVSTFSEADLLIVDDSSTDGTGQLADELAANNPCIHVIHRASKLGMGTAYVDGFAWARRHDYSQIVQMDADGSHDPRALPDILEQLDGADLVIGSRRAVGGRVLGWSLRRRLLSHMARIYCRLLLGLSLGDPTSGYRAFGERALTVLGEIPIRSTGFAFQIEIAYRLSQRGLKIREHPIWFTERVAGRSKLSAKVVAEALVLIPLLKMSVFVDELE